jgi:hypothetical protein
MWFKPPDQDPTTAALELFLQEYFLQSIIREKGLKAALDLKKRKERQGTGALIK